MTGPTLDCAVQYAKYWIQKERAFVEELTSSARAIRLGAIRRAAGYFRISRNFRRAFDVARGVERLAPALDLLEASRLIHISSENLGEVVASFRRQLGAAYGRDLLSASTKLLWLRHRDPVVIFDNQARLALGTRIGDYDSYLQRWHDGYAIHADRICKACESLAASRTIAADASAREDISTTANEEWFRRRVYDIYLWNRGAPK